ncbi:hypothetical protein AYI70_g8645 [Smittium culicis]|uniref:Uncharacterized protein n=1 Tax=Smittium culicis TaxID=133412 RepID=A0A1R1XF15_9FUNG|nr:hypothetical protein AYI70_g8645 [Smittium culicis]
MYLIQRQDLHFGYSNQILYIAGDVINYGITLWPEWCISVRVEPDRGSGGSGAKKRKFTVIGKQSLEFDPLEEKRSFLETEGVKTYEIEFSFQKKKKTT